MTSEQPPPCLLDATERLLLEASSVTQHADDAVRWAQLVAEVEDWNRFIMRADAAHLSPLLYRSLASLPNDILPAHVAAHLKRSYQTVLAQNIILYNDFQVLCDIWSTEGINIMPLKGIYLAEKVYGDIGLRHLSDLDLLVRAEELERCVSISAKHGWEVHHVKHHSAHFEERYGTYHPYKLIKGGTVAELHIHIHRPGISPAVRIEDFWERSSAGMLSSCTIREAHPIDMLLHLCLHLHKHLSGTEVKIVSFCDIKEFITLHGPLNWAKMMQRADDYAATQQVAAVLHLCRTYWHCDIPEMVTTTLSQQEADEVTHIFLQFFVGGKLSLGDRQQLALKERIKTFQAAKGTRVKLRFLCDYFFPEKSYLTQVHGEGPLAFLRLIHLLSLMHKAIRVTGNWLSGKLRSNA